MECQRSSAALSLISLHVGDIKKIRTELAAIGGCKQTPFDEWDRRNVDPLLESAMTLVDGVLQKLLSYSHTKISNSVHSSRAGARGHEYVEMERKADLKLQMSALEETDWAALRYLNDLVKCRPSQKTIQGEGAWDKSKTYEAAPERAAQIDAFEGMKQQIRDCRPLMDLLKEAQNRGTRSVGR